MKMTFRIARLLFSFILSLSLSFIPQNVKPDKEKAFDWDNASIYYLMTDRFSNGDETNDLSYGRKKTGNDTGSFQGGDFKGITQKIEEGYFDRLGVDALWISAPYEQIHGFVSGGKNGEFAHYAYHGYYPLDYTMTDADFGTVEEFRELTEKAHEKGMRIILDVVVNHAGYATIKDMEEFGFGKMSIDSSWEPGEGENYSSYNNFIDYEDDEAWKTWWGKDWIRADLPGYTKGGNDDQTMNLSGLPDFKTESTKTVAIPQFLKNKWSNSGSSSMEYSLDKASLLRQDRNLTPAGYLTLWLAEWVREFGIDGFRMDTAKHINPELAVSLKKEADTALKEWRLKNPDKPGSHFTDDFFMFGEIWGYTPENTTVKKDGYDALINFGFQGESTDGPAYNMKSMEKTMEKYSSFIEKEDTDIVSYISSHDTRLYPRGKLKEGLAYLSLLPGTIEIFYGDESGRKYQESYGDPSQSGRSFMNWETSDEEIFNHAAKLLTFRKNNVAVGAGIHTTVSENPFIFMRKYDKKGVENTVIAAVGLTEDTEINMKGFAQDGDVIRDWYTDREYTVKDGKITVVPGREGLVLLGKVKR